MKNVLTTTAMLALLTAPVFAQEITYGQAELDYSSAFDDDDDLSVTELNGEIEYTINQFVLGAAFASATLSFSGDTINTTTIFNGFAGYMITPEVLVGAGLSSASVDVEGGDEFEQDGYEVFAQYRTDQFGVGINYAEPDSDADDFSIIALSGEANVAPGIGLEARLEQVEDVDGTAYALAATYEDGPISARAFTFGDTDIDDSNAFGVRGGYGITPEIALLGGFGTAEDVTSFSAGASYAFAEGLSAEAMLGTLEIGESDVSTFDLRVTYTLGDRKRLDSDILDNFADDASQVLGTFLNAF